MMKNIPKKYLKHFSFIPAYVTVETQCRSDFTDITQKYSHLIVLKIDDAYVVW